MLRRLMCTLALSALLLAVGTPAQAKGPEKALVSWPGHETVTVTYKPGRTGVTLDQLTSATAMYNVWAVHGDPELPTVAAPHDRGVRYTVVYVFGNESFTQHLYPEASGGPRVYTPTGQAVWELPILSGWLDAPTELIPVLERIGATPKPAGAEQAFAAEDSPQPAVDESSAGISRWWLVVPIGALGLIAGLVLAARRRGWRLRSA